jgi:hypothetical protein
MKKRKRIALAVILDLGFLAFLYFAPIIYIPTLGMTNCPPEPCSACLGYYESTTLFATYTRPTSGYGLQLIGCSAFIFYGGEVWMIYPTFGIKV